MSSPIVIEEIFLAHQHSGHNKGYVSRVLESTLHYEHVVAWGGIGRKFQEKRVTFNSRWAAQQAHERIVDEKFAKGYTTCTPGLLGQVSLRDKVVAPVTVAAPRSAPARAAPSNVPVVPAPTVPSGPRKTRLLGGDEF